MTFKNKALVNIAFFVVANSCYIYKYLVSLEVVSFDLFILYINKVNIKRKN